MTIAEAFAMIDAKNPAMVGNMRLEEFEELRKALMAEKGDGSS